MAGLDPAILCNAAVSQSEPVTDAEFDRLIAPLGPFEPAPRLAVAVSGGRDSLALALLAADWARARGGTLVGLIVDHGLRPESAAEARQVQAWLAARDIPCVILRWRPDAAGQAAARAARYRLLTGWCRRRGVLHLLLAHQADDQAETVAMRAGRGSGPDGLAGMPAVARRNSVRLLRPLLAVPRARLAATCRARGQTWLDDPSNSNPKYARTMLRARSLPAPDPEALARRLATAAAVDRLLAQALSLRPEGYAWLDRAALPASDLGVAAVARALRTVGDLAYPLPGEAVRRALSQSVATLGGCVMRQYQGRLLIAREAGRLPAPVAARAGRARWAGFRISGPAGDWWVGGNRRPDLAAVLPTPVRAALPMVYDALGPLALPHLGWSRRSIDTDRFRVAWRPAVAISGPGFSVA